MDGFFLFLIFNAERRCGLASWDDPLADTHSDDSDAGLFETQLGDKTNPACMFLLLKELDKINTTFNMKCKNWQ